MTKRFTIDDCGTLIDMTTRDTFDYVSDVVDLLNSLTEENEQLKQTISKIDFAIIRKYDNSLENLLDEVYDGEYNNWIQKQSLRAKKLNGDVE